MTDHTTDRIEFRRIGDGSWRVETAQRSGGLEVVVRMDFTRDPQTPIWGAERLAIEKAHALLGKWLQMTQGPGGTSDP